MKERLTHRHSERENRSVSLSATLRKIISSEKCMNRKHKSTTLPLLSRGPVHFNDNFDNLSHFIISLLSRRFLCRKFFSLLFSDGRSPFISFYSFLCSDSINRVSPSIRMDALEFSYVFVSASTSVSFYSESDLFDKTTRTDISINPVKIFFIDSEF